MIPEELLRFRPVDIEACRNPEMPPTASTRFETNCPACLLALCAAISHPPPAGSFDGWYRHGDSIRAEMLEKGVTLPC